MAQSDQKSKEGSGSVEPTRQSEVDSRRRRLVAGAAAAPAIFTLYSGAARANASHYHCIVDTVESPSELFSSDPSNQNVQRFASRSYSATTAQPTDSFGGGDVNSIITITDGMTSQPLVQFNSDQMTNSQLYTAADGRKWILESSGTKAYPEQDPSTVWDVDVALETETVDIFWQVGNQGQLLGTDPYAYGDDGRAVFNSCWASFT